MEGVDLSSAKYFLVCLHPAKMSRAGQGACNNSVKHLVLFNFCYYAIRNAISRSFLLQLIDQLLKQNLTPR